jgi:hypothetical protein
MNIPEFTAEASLYKTRNRYRSSRFGIGSLSPDQVVPAADCPLMGFRGPVLDSLGLELYFFVPQICNDAINVRWATPGGSWQQFEFDPFDHGDGSGCIPFSGWCGYNIGRRINADLGKPYLFQMQSCRTRTLAPSVCNPWSEVKRYLPYGPDTCQDGYVWREASPSDRVCVSPWSRDVAKFENKLGPSRVSPTDHTFGPDTCRPGYVWREAFPNDHVCVPPVVRARSLNENAEAWKHYARNWS